MWRIRTLGLKGGLKNAPQLRDIVLHGCILGVSKHREPAPHQNVPVSGDAHQNASWGSPGGVKSHSSPSRALYHAPGQKGEITYFNAPYRPNTQVRSGGGSTRAQEWEVQDLREELAESEKELAEARAAVRAGLRLMAAMWEFGLDSSHVALHVGGTAVQPTLISKHVFRSDFCLQKSNFQSFCT